MKYADIQASNYQIMEILYCLNILRKHIMFVLECIVRITIHCCSIIA